MRSPPKSAAISRNCSRAASRSSTPRRVLGLAVDPGSESSLDWRRSGRRFAERARRDCEDSLSRQSFQRFEHIERFEPSASSPQSDSSRLSSRNQKILRLAFRRLARKFKNSERPLRSPVNTTRNACRKVFVGLTTASASELSTVSRPLYRPVRDQVPTLFDGRIERAVRFDPCVFRFDFSKAQTYLICRRITRRDTGSGLV